MAGIGEINSGRVQVKGPVEHDVQSAAARKFGVRAAHGENSGEPHRGAHGRADARSFHAFGDGPDAGAHARGFEHRASVGGFVSVIRDLALFILVGIFAAAGSGVGRNSVEFSGIAIGRTRLVKRTRTSAPPLPFAARLASVISP